MRRVVVVLSMLGFVEHVAAASIELHNPNYPLSSCLTLGGDEAASFWVVLHPNGATNIVGAQFRVSGLPTGCSVTATPSAAAVVSEGDMFSEFGTQILFSSPQTSASVTLFEVSVSCPASSLDDYVTLQPEAVLSDIPGFGCPVVIITDTPGPAYACAESAAISNHPIWCEIRVEPTTWSATKARFR